MKAFPHAWPTMSNATASDPFDLQRFVDAQAANYDQAIAELRAGLKRTHWSWYVLPQLRGLGSSAMSIRYGVSGLAEAQAYLGHPLLGERLRETVEAITAHPQRSAAQILGPVDAQKYRSCLTLFERASGGDALFRNALATHFVGAADAPTLTLLARRW